MVISNKRGTVLLGTVLILITISLIGATLIILFSSVAMVAEVKTQSTQAFYLSEACIAKAIHELKESAGSSPLEPEQTQEIKLGAGTCEIHNDTAASVITSIGKVQGVRRVIQVKYRPF